MRFETLNEWLTWLEQLHPKAIDLGLDRVHSVAKQMQILPLSATVITVAGSNGKGSTIAALEAILREPHGNKLAPQMGVYTSPHLISFTERIVVNQLPVSEAELCEALERVDVARLATANSSQQAISLSYFEFTTLAALAIFAVKKLDYVLLEVGLGGRLDAVNIVDPDISLICTIALDHQAWLGDTREEIAREKAGILRHRGRTVIGENDPPKSLQQQVALLDCDCWWASERSHNDQGEADNTELQPQEGHGFIRENGDLHWVGYNADRRSYRIGPLPEPKLMKANWSTALQTALLLDALPAASRLVEIVDQTHLLGRRSAVRYAEREFILDVGHNIEAITALAASLPAEPEKKNNNRYCFVFAVMEDKSYVEMITLLAPLAKQWFLPQLSHCPRACSPQLLHDTLITQFGHSANANTTDTMAESLKQAIQNTRQNDKIIVCGSFYTVAAAMDHFTHDSMLTA